MPKDHKKRGRREEKKRKREEEQVFQAPLTKRQRSDEPEQEQDWQTNLAVEGDVGDDFIGFHEKADPLEVVFYGLLDEEEQEYFANVNTKLELNDFEDADDKTAFIDAVYRESNGKELKVACSQSCSRYMERLILLSNPDQLRSLFTKFQTHFLHLVQHRFASHCCEALFLQSARRMEEVGIKQSEGAQDGNGNGTFEDLFLGAVKELSDSLGYLLTERFASHAVRVLILVLSGESLDQDSASQVVSSRKKEKIEIESGKEPVGQNPAPRKAVPSSFGLALQKLIGSATSSLNTTYLRALATHPTGNPVLQLLLRLELTGAANLSATEESSIFRRLFPENISEEDSDGAKFAQGLLYDPSGSRLMECLVQNASGKIFKKMYRNLLKERMITLAKNDIASYVVIRVIQRLGKDELAVILDQVLPEIPGLIEKNRVALVRTLIERCEARGVNMQSLLVELKNGYGVDPSARLSKILKQDKSSVSGSTADDAGPATAQNPKLDLHGSLLAQTILQTPALNSFLQESLLAQTGIQLVQLALDPIASRVIQAALNSTVSQPSFRRQFIPIMLDHIFELATDVSGSHVVDSLWDGTADLHFLKERIARELQSHEAELRDSRYGRVVWRNWSMDMFSRRKAEWQARAKGLDFAQAVEQKTSKKSGIELARARFAAKKAHGKTEGDRTKPVSSTVSANA
ncbi:putative rrna processing protein [Phaeomoniella chlamydospora]|uniref:Nucleolar protein 9 n=1 Tax=Phaeomoniella chlamydospora TaxID=158046 RepID=A0A0G2FU08_PHACM|nr:putative rrna processing protein [Phaeomoniella chlamydospora]